MQQGSLDPPEADVARIRELAAKLPVVLVFRLDPPEIVTSLADTVASTVTDSGE